MFNRNVTLTVSVDHREALRTSSVISVLGLAFAFAVWFRSRQG
jgi:hypothetical protein